MKHLLTGVALAALIGLAPAAMAQGGSATTPQSGKEAIKDQREAQSQSGATVKTPGTGSSGLTQSDTRSAPNKGAAEGSKGTAAGTTGNTAGSGTATGAASTGMTHGGSTGASSGMASDKTMMNKGARKGAASSGSSTMSQSGDDATTRQLNQQELGRLRSGAGG
jgi:hypothetical protein